jgi:hypothetical protein
MHYTTKKSQKRVANLGYGWAINHAKISANHGVLNIFFITHNSKIFCALINGGCYKVISPYGDDMTERITPNQFLDGFGVDRNGRFIGMSVDKVPMTFVKKNLPETVYKKISEFSGYQNSYGY